MRLPPREAVDGFEIRIGRRLAPRSLVGADNHEEQLAKTGPLEHSSISCVSAPEAIAVGADRSAARMKSAAPVKSISPACGELLEAGALAGATACGWCPLPSQPLVPTQGSKHPHIVVAKIAVE